MFTGSTKKSAVFAQVRSLNMSPNFEADDDEKSRSLTPKIYISSNDLDISSKSKKQKRQKQDKRISGELSVFQKLCFGVGGLPYEMTSNCLGLFIPTFLLEIAGLRPRDLSIILFYGKVWDALTDPLIGYVVSKTESRFGKLRPWIIFAAPFAVLSYMMVWYVPDIEKDLMLYWYLAFYCLFQTFLSCLHVPYTSLTMYLTHNQKERDSATGYRMSLEVLGVFLAATIQGVMITIYGMKFSCKSLPSTFHGLNETASNYSDFMQNSSVASRISTSHVVAEIAETAGYNKLGEGYLVSAGIMGAIYLLCCMTTFFGTKEIDDVISDKNNHFISSITSVFKSKAYLTLLFSYLFNSVASKLLQTNFALYCKHSIDAKSQYQLLIIVLLVAIILSMPAWQYAIKKFGKKTTYGIGLITFIPNLVPLMFITDQIWLMYIITIFCGISMSSHFLLPWSMLPDVIDEYMVKNGERKEAIFYSFFVFFTKFSSGISVAFSSLFLEYSGYLDCPNGCCEQPESIKLALRVLLFPIPVVMILISMACLYLHPINEKRRKENKISLDILRKKSRDALLNSIE